MGLFVLKCFLLQLWECVLLTSSFSQLSCWARWKHELKQSKMNSIKNAYTQTCFFSSVTSVSPLCCPGELVSVVGPGTWSLISGLQLSAFVWCPYQCQLPESWGSLLPGALTCLTCGTTSILKGEMLKKTVWKLYFLKPLTKLHIFSTESLILRRNNEQRLP